MAMRLDPRSNVYLPYLVGVHNSGYADNSRYEAYEVSPDVTGQIKEVIRQRTGISTRTTMFGLSNLDVRNTGDGLFGGNGEWRLALRWTWQYDDGSVDSYENPQFLELQAHDGINQLPPQNYMRAIPDNIARIKIEILGKSYEEDGFLGGGNDQIPGWSSGWFNLPANHFVPENLELTKHNSVVSGETAYIPTYGIQTVWH